MSILFILFLAIFACTAAIFIIVRSIVFKLTAGFIFILSVVMMFVVFGDNIKSKTSPLAINDEVVQLYIEGEKVTFPKSDVVRIYVGKPTDKVKVEFINVNAQYTIEISNFAYEWAVKNKLKRDFKSKLDVAQF